MLDEENELWLILEIAFISNLASFGVFNPFSNGYLIPCSSKKLSKANAGEVEG